MTPIVSHTVKDVPAVPNALTLKNVGFWNTQGGAMEAPGNTAIRPWFTPWVLIARLFPPGAEVLQVSDPAASDGIRSQLLLGGAPPLGVASFSDLRAWGHGNAS